MCAGMFSSEVQFGHAGACANAERETAVAKNKALSEAGASVPSSFDELGVVSVVALQHNNYLFLTSWHSYLTTLWTKNVVGVVMYTKTNFTDKN